VTRARSVDLLAKADSHPCEDGGKTGDGEKPVDYGIVGMFLEKRKG